MSSRMRPPAWDSSRDADGGAGQALDGSNGKGANFD
jgi:hypothetical protein